MTPVRRIVVIVGVGLAVVLLAAFVLRPRGDARTEGGVVEMDQPLPDLTSFETVSGDRLPADAFDGEVTVINAWATWCDPCLREQPALLATQERYAGQDVEFVGINYGDDRDLARRWISEKAVDYPSIYDPDGRTAALLDYPFVPNTYLVDAGGTIRYAIFGETDEDELSGLIDDVLTQNAGSDAATAT